MNYEQFRQKLIDILKENNLDYLLDENNSKIFYKLAEILKETNKSLNLTAVCDDDGIILKHFADSLLIESLIPRGAHVIDVGCGGGFPTFPLAIIRSDLKITAIDSTEKKINFVMATSKALNLSNITAISARAEELTKDSKESKNDMREKFDIATARAVASLPILTELCMPFVKVGGKFIAMKASKAPEEIESTINANLFKELGGEESPQVTEIELKHGEEKMQRTIICVKKIQITSKKYPRNYSQISKAAKKLLNK